MDRAEQALHEILSLGIDEQAPEVLMLRARALIETFKANAGCQEGLASGDDRPCHMASDLAKLRDAVDGEIDRRVDEDLADGVCDLLEHLSEYLHAEGGLTDTGQPQNHPEKAISERN